MEIKVDQDLCISCGLCVSNCPDIFAWNEEEKAEVVQEDIDQDLEDCIRDAAGECPTDAIETA